MALIEYGSVTVVGDAGIALLSHNICMMCVEKGFVKWHESITVQACDKPCCTDAYRYGIELTVYVYTGYSGEGIVHRISTVKGLPWRDLDHMNEKGRYMTSLISIECTTLYIFVHVTCTFTMGGCFSVK